MTLENPKIAVIGLGRMGSRYVRRLLETGYSVTVWNRTPDRAKSIVRQGAKLAASVPEALDEATIIIASMEDSTAFKATLLTPEALAHFRSHHLVIDTSTTSPEFSRFAHALIGRCLADFLDAPVSGGTVGAERGTLAILIGGEQSVFERARPVLEALGTPHLLGAVGAGQIAKLANQVIVAVTIGAVAEGLFLAERAGLDGAKLIVALKGGFADSRIMREHGDRMVRRNFTAGAANRIFLKDLRLVEKLAEKLATTLPLTGQCARVFSELVGSGFFEQDHSSYHTYLECINSDSD